MRTIEEKIIAALRSGNGLKKLSCRDSVKVEENKIEYYLCDNLLFWSNSDSIYFFSVRGWNSQTTKNRLNAILYNFLRVYIYYTKNYKWVLNWNQKEYLIDATNIFYFKGDKLYLKASHDVEVLPIENKIF